MKILLISSPVSLPGIENFAKLPDLVLASDIIGFSAMTFHYNHTLKLVKIIRRMRVTESGNEIKSQKDLTVTIS